jgi:hypothetical protein
MDHDLTNPDDTIQYCAVGSNVGHPRSLRARHVIKAATKGGGLSCTVLASPCGNVNDFVFSLLPELDAKGSKQGRAGVTHSSIS